MYKKAVFTLFIFLFCLTVTILKSQSIANYRIKTLTIDSIAIDLDTLTIIPNSFSINGINPNEYAINLANAELTINDSTLIGRSITCTYRVFSIDFSKKMSRKSPDIILNKMVSDPTIHNIQSIPAPIDELLFDNSLQGTGSISRSISVGNNQNFVLGAHLNLQLSGYLSPEVEILANITDENLPIQPEGNTRVIKDFNKIFIQLKYKDLLTIKAGDIELKKNDNSYFMVVNRQFLGIDLTTHSQIDSANSVHNTIGGGVSKGRFTRNTIAAIHGVQGPYKLRGEQNETAIIILAGSERVYIDGILLTRGLDNDYVIDYNTGEITFTAQNLITNEKRIIVEFEYSDRNYSRFNLFTYNEFLHEKNNRIKLNVNFFHEQDLKNQSIQPELDNDQKLFLSQLGDRLDEANYPAASLADDYTTSEILYAKKDTLVNGTNYSPIYYYSISHNDTLYRLTFSYLGINKGNYKLSQSSANGKVFHWVAPQDGIPQGEYEPVIYLNTPKMRNMATIAATYDYRDKLLIQTELAFSYLDNNLFSNQGEQDNAGLAYQLNIGYKNPMRKHKTWSFFSLLNYEYVHQNFNPLESYREVEFGREYNLSTDYAVQAAEQMVKFKAGFLQNNIGQSYYAIDWLSRQDQLTALRNELTSTHEIRKWKWATSTSYLISSDDIQKTNFLKSYNDFSKTISKIKIGVRDNLEYNVFTDKSSDSLRSNSYAFNESAIYLKSSDSARYKLGLQLKNRIYNSLYNNVLSTNSIAYEAQLNFEISHWKNNRLKGTATYRYDNIRDTARNFYSEQNFVGNIEYMGKYWKGAVSLSIFYEAGSGLEQKKNYTYLKVSIGQGTHVWNDYNHNGIEELNEFEVAVFQDEADYVKVWLTTNEYVNTYNNGLTQTLQLRPANVWRDKKGFRRFLSMFSNTTTLRTYQKNTIEHDIRAFNPFQFNLSDSVLVNYNINLKNNLSFNPAGKFFILEFMVMQNQSKTLMYYGFENHAMKTQQLDLQSSPNKIMTLKTTYLHILKENDSQYFGDRNYRICTHSLTNSATFNFLNNLSFSVLFDMIYKKNENSTEKSNQYKVEGELDFRIRERSNINFKIQYINILYNSNINDGISYEMLGGLSTGNNFLWNLTCQTKIFEYLQINLQYEGRVSQDAKIIHFGFMQIKAFF